MITPPADVPADAHTDPSIHYPRILCLHGGGTNTRIFRAQCRALEAKLRSRFRLVYAEAPFLSQQPGPDVLSVYSEWGPFRRWLNDGPEGMNDRLSIEAALTQAIDEDDAKGGEGDWVAVMGFSQGAKVAASWLVRQQQQEDLWGQTRDRQRSGCPRFQFGMLMAGRGPLVELDKEIRTGGEDKMSNLLWLPTIHVHGLQDPGLELHRQMLRDGCGSGSTRLVEWIGDHRLPIKTADVELVVDSVMATARELGVLC